MMDSIDTEDTINNNNNKKPEFEIVGLHQKGSGRFCCMHSHCGMHVAVGDVLRLVHVVVTTSDLKEPEDAIKLVKIVDGTESCTVAFIPRAFARLERISTKIGSFCVVLELYDNSNKYKQLLSKKNYGVASCLFLDDVPRHE